MVRMEVLEREKMVEREGIVDVWFLVGFFWWCEILIFGRSERKDEVPFEKTRSSVRRGLVVDVCMNGCVNVCMCVCICVYLSVSPSVSNRWIYESMCKRVCV